VHSLAAEALKPLETRSPEQLAAGLFLLNIASAAKAARENKHGTLEAGPYFLSFSKIGQPGAARKARIRRAVESHLRWAR
jgi:hypothetical protein